MNRPADTLDPPSASSGESIILHPQQLGSDRPRQPVWAGQRRKLMLATGDLLAIVLGLLLASTVARLDRSAWIVVYASLPVWPAILTHQFLYRERFIVRGADEGSRIVKSVVGGVSAVALLGLFLDVEFARRWYPIAFVTVLFFLGSARLVARYMFKRSRRNRQSLRRVLIIGKNAEGQFMREMIESDPDLGYEVIGFLDDLLRRSAGDSDLTVLGNAERALAAVRACDATGVILATTALDVGTSNRLIRAMADNGIHVELSSSLCDIASERLTVRPLGRIPMMYIEPRERHGWRATAKRSFDLLVASILLVLTAPLIAAAMLAVKLTSSGPVVFRQDRVGRDGETFPVLKLRTMVENAEELLDDLRHLNEAEGPLFKIADDPRVTKAGRFLRKTSIDELPQLWNVLRGEMSLVGPRPALPSEVASWDPSLHNRLRVQPGITGMWQVQGRSSSTEGDYAQLDLYYVDNWTLVTDILILIRTIPAVLSQRGAL